MQSGRIDWHTFGFGRDELPCSWELVVPNHLDQRSTFLGRPRIVVHCIFAVSRCDCEIPYDAVVLATLHAFGSSIGIRSKKIRSDPPPSPPMHQACQGLEHHTGVRVQCGSLRTRSGVRLSLGSIPSPRGDVIGRWVERAVFHSSTPSLLLRLPVPSLRPQSLQSLPSIPHIFSFPCNLCSRFVRGTPCVLAKPAIARKTRRWPQVIATRTLPPQVYRKHSAQNPKET